MKRMSLQWRLTCIITLYIALICGCLTLLVYKNGVYYIDSLQETVDAQGDDNGSGTDEIYISIPEDKWDEFANDFSVKVYNNKADYKKNSLIISALLALLGGVATYFISGHALKPISEFSDKIEDVQAQNLADSRIEENSVKELNQLSVSYNKMLERLSDAFEQIFDMLEGDMQLFHMLLKNDSGKCLEKFRSIYIERGAGFALMYYDELYKRGIAVRKLSKKTVYMLSLAEFSMVCEIIADNSCQSGVTSEMKTAFMEAMNVLLHGIEAELQIDRAPDDPDRI